MVMLRATFAATLMCYVACADTCPINESLISKKTSGIQPHDKGEFTPEGWRVTTPNTQIKYDLGRFYSRGSVEMQVRGPLSQPLKHSLIALWNEEAAVDGNRKTQSFYQLRLQETGMMLRLTNRSDGRSFEGKTGSLDFGDGWHTVRGTWDTKGGENHLWLDGKSIKSGKFNAEFPGFRWVFIGKDNYQEQFSVPGIEYRNLKVCVE